MRAFCRYIAGSAIRRMTDKLANMQQSKAFTDSALAERCKEKILLLKNLIMPKALLVQEVDDPLQFFDIDIREKSAFHLIRVTEHFYQFYELLWQALDRYFNDIRRLTRHTPSLAFKFCLESEQLRRSWEELFMNTHVTHNTALDG